jgi:hypothetical protein
MPEETIDDMADRLDRQADRYRNAGDFKREQEARQAANEVRHSTALAGAQDIERAFNLTHSSDADQDATAPQRLDPGTSGHWGSDRYVVYDDELRAGGSRAWRNNNPGNIEDGNFARAHGAIGSDGRMAVFPDTETGRQALRDLLSTDTYSDLNIRDALSRYAPAIENNVDSYVNAIANQTGLSADTVLGDMSDAQLDAVVGAIQTHEGWTEGDVYDGGEESPQWAREVLGQPSTPGDDPHGDPSDDDSAPTDNS